MLLDQELKSIQEAKNRLALCCDLRRCLVQIEIQSIGSRARRITSNLILGLAVAGQILDLIRKRKSSRR